MCLLPVEGLYCKMSIQCLASSDILTPYPFTAGECVPTPPPSVLGEDTLARGRGGGGSNSSEDARHCSVLYTYKYFVLLPLSHYLELICESALFFLRTSRQNILYCTGRKSITKIIFSFLQARNLKAKDINGKSGEE
jgi:hypothetical protein